MEKFVN
jgi:hypothetical protein